MSRSPWTVTSICDIFVAQTTRTLYIHQFILQIARFAFVSLLIYFICHIGMQSAIQITISQPFISIQIPIKQIPLLKFNFELYMYTLPALIYL